MNDVRVTSGYLVVSLQGIRRLLAFKSRLTMPLAKVRGASVDAGIPTGWPGFRKAFEWPGRKVLGTDLYGLYLGGTFVQDGDRVFWDVARPEKAIVITLENYEYQRLYIQVDDPDAAVRSIEAALAAR